MPTAPTWSLGNILCGIRDQISNQQHLIYRISNPDLFIALMFEIWALKAESAQFSINLEYLVAASGRAR
jgi:hypothetical protein